MNKQKVKEQIASNMGIMLLHIFDLVDEISAESFQYMFDESVETLDDRKIARAILDFWFKVCATKKRDLLNEAVYAALEKFQKQYIDEEEPANDEQRVE